MRNREGSGNAHSRQMFTGYSSSSAWGTLPILQTKERHAKILPKGREWAGGVTSSVILTPPAYPDP